MKLKNASGTISLEELRAVRTVSRVTLDAERLPPLLGPDGPPRPSHWDIRWKVDDAGRTQFTFRCALWGHEWAAVAWMARCARQRDTMCSAAAELFLGPRMLRKR